MEIISDYSSGSQELNEKILLLLLKTRSERTFRNLIQIFIEVFKQFAVIQTTLKKLDNKLTKSNLQETKNTILKILENQNSKFEKLYRKVKGKIYKGIKILTFSNSYTCLKLFEKIYSDDFEPKFYIPVSNPGGEGKILFEKIINLGAKARLIPDKNLKQVISKIDIVFVGADKILPGLYFINKIGTKQLAQLAKDNSKQFYVVGLKEKIIECKDEVSESKVSLRNKDKRLFEKIQTSLVTEFFIA
ncbi:MAG: hypothetical protein ACPL25_09905 [Ignavibacteria bacterium]